MNESNELRKLGAETLAAYIKLCQENLEAGADYLKKLDFHSAIKEFTAVIDTLPKMTNLEINLNLPPEVKHQVKITFASLANSAYSGRSLAYIQIGETEKGNADKIMAGKFENDLNVPYQGENHNIGNSNQTPPAKQIPNSVTSIVDNAFSHRESLTSGGSLINLENLVKKIETLSNCLNTASEDTKQNNYYSAIANFNKIADNLDEALYLAANNESYPPAIIAMYLNVINSALLGRKIAYMSIGEEEKARADGEMIKHVSAIINDVNAKSTLERIKEENKKDDNSLLSIGSFALAIILLVITILISYFTGISFGTSLLIAVVVVVALLIWIGTHDG